MAGRIRPGRGKLEGLGGGESPANERKRSAHELTRMNTNKSGKIL